jgi:hypothetical protein
MTSSHTSSVEEICARVKQLGYEPTKRIRLYGEEFEVISDPFPTAGGIAVHVKSKNGSETRMVQLPATIVQGVSGTLPKAA